MKIPDCITFLLKKWNKTPKGESFRSGDLPECPEYAKKIIYWDAKTKSGSAFILVGYCPARLDYFLSMYLKAKEDYPDLKFTDCECGKINKSSCYFGFTLLTFEVHKKVEGWEIYGGEIDFFW